MIGEKLWDRTGKKSSKNMFIHLEISRLPVTTPNIAINSCLLYTSLTGIIQTSTNALNTLKQVTELKANIEREKILNMGKRSKTATELLHYLFKKPVVNVKEIQKKTGLSAKAANDLIKVFLNEGILREITGFQRNRIFVFDEYMNLFNK